jgi:Flp pilus assembly protein TadG
MWRSVNLFGRDDRGAISVVAAVAMVALIAMVGLAVDVARAYNARTLIANSLDSATLAATRDLSNGLATEEEIVSTVQLYYDQNLALNRAAFRDNASLDVTIDEVAGIVRAASRGTIPATFLRIVGIETIDVSSATSATYSTRQIELSLVVDVTGSMAQLSAGGTVKIDDLKAAAASLIDILLPSDGRLDDRVRIALIPFSQAVNAGALAGSVKVTGLVNIGGTTYYSQGGNCVAERPNEAFDDIDPRVTRLLLRDPEYRAATRRRSAQYGDPVPCPAQAVLPLTGDSAAIQAAIGSLAAIGGTAGHVGVAWGWYMLSPTWASLLPVESRPSTDEDVMKIVVFMTDGVFTYDSYSGADGRNPSDYAIEHAIGYCEAARREGIRIFTIAFDVSGETRDDIRARDTMRRCASSANDYFEAEDGAALEGAFATIAHNVNSIWLSQ